MTPCKPFLPIIFAVFNIYQCLFLSIETPPGLSNDHEGTNATAPADLEHSSLRILLLEPTTRTQTSLVTHRNIIYI